MFSSTRCRTPSSLRHQGSFRLRLVDAAGDATRHRDTKQARFLGRDPDVVEVAAFADRALARGATIPF
jgi:hypothetical protein